MTRQTRRPFYIVPTPGSATAGNADTYGNEAGIVRLSFEKPGTPRSPAEGIRRATLWDVETDLIALGRLYWARRDAAEATAPRP